MSRLHHLPRFLTSLALCLVATTGAQAREMVSVQRAEVNLRAGAGTQHEARWVLSRGYPLEVTGRKGQWLHVRDFENDTGWIFRPLVGKQANHVVKGNVVICAAARALARASWVKVQQAGGPRGWVARRLLWGW